MRRMKNSRSTRSECNVFLAPRTLPQGSAIPVLLPFNIFNQTTDDEAKGAPQSSMNTSSYIRRKRNFRGLKSGASHLPSKCERPCPGHVQRERRRASVMGVNREKLEETRDKLESVTDNAA
jgi:hypothetical protein